MHPDIVLVMVCGRDKWCLSVRLTCLLCVCTVFCSIFAEEAERHQIVRREKAPKREIFIRNRNLVIPDD